MPVEQNFNESNPYGSSATVIEGSQPNPDTPHDTVVRGTGTEFFYAPLDTRAAA